MSTALVTGATGNVGSKLVRALRARGVAVRAFVRDREKGRALLGHDVDLAVGDFAAPDSIRAAMDGVDAVFLACANDPRQVEYEMGVIDAAAGARVRRMVKLSAVGAEVGSPLSFWAWHGRIERHLRDSGLPAVVLRPTMYMTTLLGSAETIKRTGRLFAPAGGARIAMIDPRDVADLAAVVLTEDGHAGQTYVLTGPEALTYEEIAAHLSRASGRTIEFVDVPDEAARAALVQAGMPEWMAEQLVVLFGLLRRGAMAQTTGAVQALTGRGGRPFAAFAREHVHLFGA
ncbi:MAG TPA: SDR family oxidoreductase [Chloroflexota bacterium]|nr:SDR family oxidoreductase [Chloroflexota bacterium]